MVKRLTEEEMMEQDRRHWHIGREIPLAVIFAILVQTVGIVWWASSLSGRVDQLEKNNSASAWQAEKIIRIDEKLNTVQTTMSELKTAIQQQPTTIIESTPRKR
jgi:hypothetical protein